MTNKELREVLAQYPDDARVQVFDESYGYVDITEIFQSAKKGLPFINIV